jgi:hypothetical protein
VFALSRTKTTAFSELTNETSHKRTSGPRCLSGHPEPSVQTAPAGVQAHRCVVGIPIGAGVERAAFASIKGPGVVDTRTCGKGGRSYGKSAEEGKTLGRKDGSAPTRSRAIEERGTEFAIVPTAASCRWTLQADSV